MGLKPTLLQGNGERCSGRGPAGPEHHILRQEQGVSLQVTVGANLFLNHSRRLGLLDGERACSWILMFDKQAQRDYV